ncbi:MAG TPA: BTAD domain-containing putative transcriptional regulator [Longimicrobium sp.]|nr:BTAD domain-containing putative transcriptional regulator [Longimicrobium sp.]
MNCCKRGLLLRTLGHPVLTGPPGGPLAGLRRKDLALLAYLCVEGPRPHSRARLAALLWGESREAKARHSLTQALGRVVRAAGSGAVVVERDAVRSTGAVACDAEWLLAGGERLDPLLTLYEGPFLEGFEAGFGSEEFGEWADGQRAELRNAALRWLERTGEAAEAAGDWALALRIGERGTQVDPVHEEAHRRALRALLETGERNRALRHYQDFARWLADDVGGEPDPETLALVERIGAATAASPPPPPRISPRPPPALPPPVLAEPPVAEAPITVVGAVEVAADAPPRRAASAPVSSIGARAVAHSSCVGSWLFAGVLTVMLMQTTLLGRFGPARQPAIPLPGHGEAIRLEKGGPVYLAYAETLWRYPDAATLDRCLGGWRQRIRRVRALPPWPRRTLASVTKHPWQGGMAAVVTDHPQDPTQHVAMGCVLAPIPDTLTFRAIFGHTDWSRSYEEADSLLRAGPRTTEAEPYPVRTTGTLIRDAQDRVKWIVYHGGALTASPEVLATYCRSPAEAVPVPSAEFAYYEAYATLPPADPPCPGEPRAHAKPRRR